MSVHQLSRFVQTSRKIIGVARNYRSNVSGDNTDPLKPFVFFKPISSFITRGQVIKIPKPTSRVVHEVELGVVIGKGGRNIPQTQALDHVGGYCLALDMTDRAEIDNAIENGLPWDYGKGFDTSCPVSDFIPRSEVPDPDDVSLWLKVNRVMRQDSNTKNMVLSVSELVSWISESWYLEPGDIILTGTPSGADVVKAGDTIECGFKGIAEMTYAVENM